MKQTLSLSEFSRPSEFIRLYTRSLYREEETHNTDIHRAARIQLKPSLSQQSRILTSKFDNVISPAEIM